MSRYYPSRSSLAGSSSIGGDLTVSGSFWLSGSSYVTGSSSIAGNLYVSGSEWLSGSLYTTGSGWFSGSLGLTGSNTSNLYVSGSEWLGVNLYVSGSTYILGSSSISGDLAVTGSTYTLGSSSIAGNLYTSGSAYVSGTLYINNLQTYETGTLELFGTELDGGSAIGVILGSANVYSTAGSKIFVETNGSGTAGYDRAYTDYRGARVSCISDADGATVDNYTSELISISGSTTYFSVGIIPAGAMVYGVSSYVVSTFQTASVFNLGISASAWDSTDWGKWGIGMQGQAGVNNLTSSMKSGWEYYATDTPIAISSSILQGNTTATTGSVRVEIRYRTIVPPTS